MTNSASVVNYIFRTAV